MGRINLIFCCLLLVKSSFSQSNPDALYNLKGCSVNPGGLGQLILLWDIMENDSNIHLDFDAEPYFTFLNAPMYTENKRGNEAILFMTHPYTPARTHVVQVSWKINGRVIGTASAKITVNERYGVESSVIEERKDSIKVLHLNTGNVSLFVENEQLIPGDAVTIVHPRVSRNTLPVHASCSKWDSSYNIVLVERFYQSETLCPKTDSKPRMLIGTQRQWSNDYMFTMWNARIRLQGWEANAVQWNDGVRATLALANEKYKLNIGNINARAFPLLRPRNTLNLHGSLAALGLGFYLDDENLSLYKSFTTKKIESISPGLMMINQRIFPSFSATIKSSKGKINWDLLGAMQDLKWEWKSSIANTYGRMIYVPSTFNHKAVQGTSGYIGTSIRLGKYTLQHQSAAFRNTQLVHNHNTQLQWGIGRIHWVARMQLFNQTSQIISSVQATINTGQHSFSSRIQSQQSKVGQHIGLTNQYRYRHENKSLGLGAQHVDGRWTYRGQFAVHLKSLELSGLMAYSNHYFDHWFYQTRISKSINNQVFSLSSSRRFPVRIAWKGSFLTEKHFKTLIGRVLDLSGTPVENVVISCQGQSVQSDAGGKFVFRHLSGSVASISIQPESLPFAQFPVNGFEAELPIPERSQTSVVQLFTTSAFKGALNIDFSSDPAMRPRLEWKSISIHLTDSNDSTYTRMVHPNGEFKFSNLKAGDFILHVQGLGRNFESTPLTISIKEGEIVSRSILIKEVPDLIPFQKL